ncbi:hypothetical protein J7481_25995 [Labrenzia sp. R4_2]|uniref:hypothetical protein n=1 Tax=Labrenzia sp. R4_2 TaxID=2821107 RepID=UPI001ADBDB81|nr:hypothetical protein [Labrenzia sp. R4_2]MBO9422985.1 hypothetical protein [Labrenzia sp. R4_2]
MNIQENTSRIATSVPHVKAKTVENGSAKKHLNGHSMFMLACCAAMVAGTAVVIASAPAGQSLGETLLLAAPVLGCLGMHFVMHRFMGKSCHGAESKHQKND